jgi:hypothetical protein
MRASKVFHHFQAEARNDGQTVYGGGDSLTDHSCSSLFPFGRVRPTGTGQGKQLSLRLSENCARIRPYYHMIPVVQTHGKLALAPEVVRGDHLDPATHAHPK